MVGVNTEASYLEYYFIVIFHVLPSLKAVFFLAGISGVSWEDWWTYDGISGTVSCILHVV
jgi:hypothetical protein